MEDKAGFNKFDHSPSPCNGDGYGRREGERSMPGRNMANPRVEIDTSLPFGSVQEAVDHFEGSGFCLPFHCPVGIRQDQGEVDLKKVEERTLELEKNLIMKELETLDVLEELGTTKRIVEELKWKLQKEALKCMATVPESDERAAHSPPREDFGGNGQNQIRSQDVILMELNQVKSNLGKIISELRMIQTSVESLSKRIKREKELLEKTRPRLMLKPHFNATATYDQSKCTTGINAAEMKLVAARKMEEAARAVEAVAMAEIRAFSRNEASFDIYLPERKNSVSFLQEPSPTRTPHRNVEETPMQSNKGWKSNASRAEILRKLEDATEEVKLSHQVLEEALNRIAIANRKQVAAHEALREWMPKRGDRPRNLNPTKPIFSLDHKQSPSAAADLVLRTNISGNEPSPVLRTTISMRDVLGRKQILPKEHVARRQTEGHRVALSQMLNELREDLTFPAKPEDPHRNQFPAQRKKFGFIHISLPLMKQSKKNAGSAF